MKISLPAAALTALLLWPAAGPGSAVLAADELLRHTVKKGDTLWDLSGGYLQDSLLWPRIWEINPEIADPHWIYPGQQVRIPLLAPPVATPAARPGAPRATAPFAFDPAELGELTPGRPLAIRVGAADDDPERPGPRARDRSQEEQEVMALLQRFQTRGIGMVTWSLPSAGRVLPTSLGWRHAAAGETMQVELNGAARVGQRLGVYRNLGEVPPLTQGQPSPGYLVQDIAVIELTTAGPDRQQALIIQAFHELREGDLLGPVPEFPAGVPATGKVAANGLVVAVHDLRQIAAAGQLVYLDQGRRHGLAPGQTLNAAAPDHSPGRSAGEILVLRVSEDRAAAVVTGNSRHEIRPGDRFSSRP